MQHQQQAAVIVADDARVVTHAQLREMLAELGTIGNVAAELAMPMSTLSRKVRQAGIEVGIDWKQTELARLREELALLRGASDAQTH